MPEIRISETRSVEYKNGYFIYHEYSKKSERSTNPGEEYKSNTQTFLRLIKCWEVLKELGEDGNKVMNAFDMLMKDYQRKASDEFIAHKKKQKEDKAKNAANRDNA